MQPSQRSRISKCIVRNTKPLCLLEIRRFSVPNDNPTERYNLGYHSRQRPRGLVFGQNRMSPMSPVRHVRMPAMHTVSAGECRGGGDVRIFCGPIVGWR
jgi:hypothetical protein